MPASKGFTLIELMVTLLVVAIVAAIAVPSFNQLMSDTRAQTLANNLVSALNLARTEAIKRGQPVTLCPSSDGASCGATWSDGWLLFVDGASSGNPVVPGADGVLKVWGDFQAGLQVDSAAGYIRFGNLGNALLTGSNDLTLVVESEECEGDNAWLLTVRPTGRADVVRQSCGG